MLHPRMKSAAEKVLPRFLLRWLDPFQAAIDSEVLYLARSTADDDIVLDAGAGEARHRRFFEHGMYVGVDSGRGDASWDYSRLDLWGDLHELPLRACSVDTILSLVVLEHTRDPRRVIREFHRVLRNGGRLHMIVPFLWEEHQVPNDFFRFTRYGIRSLLEELPYEVDLVSPIGGFFWVCARRCVNLLGIFQGGWRWFVFVLLLPFFGFVFPLALRFLDGLDSAKNFSLGFLVRARKKEGS